MQTAELIGPALDWAVAKCNQDWTDEDRWFNTIGYVDSGDPDDEPYQPSTNWAQGGPIIEREGISTLKFEGLWYAFSDLPTHNCIHDIADGYVGETNLIAAMRCYVASKLGDEVEIPEELL